MPEPGKSFYVVSAAILPEAIRRTAQAKELLARGEAHTVYEAVEQAGLSRSAFYKYKDGVFPLHAATQGQIVTISMILEHRAGVLSRVLELIAQAQGNILTINQGIPLQGVANVAISLETASLAMPMDQLLATLGGSAGVHKIEIVSRTDKA